MQAALFLPISFSCSVVLVASSGRLDQLRAEFEILQEYRTRLEPCPPVCYDISHSVEDILSMVQVMKGRALSYASSNSSSTSFEGDGLQILSGLLSWLEKTEERVQKVTWGTDLSSVEAELHNHRALTAGIEQFADKLDEAIQLEVRRTHFLSCQLFETVAQMLSRSNTFVFTFASQD
uniref:Uncharacterized protein n=1 Tax=Eptatretus burgeri TaxID=7764 RepID=A0A8C4PXV3_EPTBU